MTAIYVHNQDELDTALNNPKYTYFDHEIIIDSPDGVWLEVHTRRYLDVRAYGSSTVQAYESSTVRAYESSTVQAYGSSTVQAGSFVAVHLFSAQVTINGGVIIDITTINNSDAKQWVDYHGAEINGDEVLLYKALSGDLVSGKTYDSRIEWPTSGVVSCDDWEPTNECGGGLHLSPHPHQAACYCEPEAERMLLCSVKLEDIYPIPTYYAPKCKVPSVTVLREVALDGGELKEEA